MAGIRLHLVRHGKAAGGWSEDADPGLDENGRRQAEARARALAPLGPLPLLVSPMRRTRETAEPLQRLWERSLHIEQAISEIPSPTEDLSERAVWLRAVMQQRWSELEPWLQTWRQALLARIGEIREETVLVSHFVAINALVGAAMGDDRCVVFRPDYASHTILELEGRRLTLESLGQEGATQVR